jgi:hypothetical protein
MTRTAKAKGTSRAKKREEVQQVELTVDEIRQRAYEIYVSRNGQAGDAIQDWLQAEHELRAAIL